MIGLKVAILSFALSALGNVVSDSMQQLALIAAGLAGVGWIFKHVLRPLAQLLKEVLEDRKVLKRLEPFMDSVEDRLERLELESRRAREPAEAMARELGVEHRHPTA